MLYSKKLNRYYKGASENPENRLSEYNAAIKPGCLYCSHKRLAAHFPAQMRGQTQALKIERYLKKSANIHYLRRFMTEMDLQQAILLRFKS